MKREIDPQRQERASTLDRLVSELDTSLKDLLNSGKLPEEELSLLQRYVAMARSGGGFKGFNFDFSKLPNVPPNVKNAISALNAFNEHLPSYIP